MRSVVPHATWVIQMSRPVAAIDCGTNTTRLLVSDGSTELVREAHITGLGRGLSTSGCLSVDALGRVERVLGRYRELLDQHGAVDLRAIATSAARDATNATEFFDMAERVLGVRPELISGAEEAALSFAGATEGLNSGAGPFLVVDIGGGSTEFAVGSGSDVEVVSVDMGSVRMTEQFVRSDPPLPEELSNLLQVIAAHMDDVRRGLPDLDEVRTIVAVAGTATTVAAVEIGLQVYDAGIIDGFILTRPAAEDVFRTLAVESLDDRRYNPGLDPARADVIVAGSAILVGVMRYLGAEQMMVRDHDILDGLIASQIN